MATTPSLRPLGVGEILDAGIKIYLRHWKPLMICVVGIVLPVQILSVLVISSIDPNQLRNAFDTSSSSSSTASGTALAAIFVVELISALGTLLATAACFKAVSDAWLGGTPTARRSLRFAARRLPRVVWLWIVLAFGLLLAFICLVIPGIWLFVAWSLAVPVVLFERVGAVKAMRRSFRLVRGRWWPICGALIVGYLLAVVVALIVEAIPTAIASAATNDSDVAYAIATIVGRTVSSMISTPYPAAIVALLYFDQRVRKEGFDLQLLAEGLETPRDPDAPLPEPLIGPRYTDAQRAAAPFWPPPPGWVPPEEEAARPPAVAEEEPRQWWQDPLPSEDDASRYGGGYARPQADESPPAAGLPAFGDYTSSRAAPPAAATSPATPATGDPPPGAADSPPAADDPPGGDSRADGDSPPSAADPPADGDSPPGGDSWGGRWGSLPPDEEEEAKRRKRDPGRADWLPPEAPRGPGGL